jgi:hypothetical protein
VVELQFEPPARKFYPANPPLPALPRNRWKDARCPMGFETRAPGITKRGVPMAHLAAYSSRKHGARTRVPRPSCLAAARRDPTSAARLIQRALNGAPLFRAAIVAVLQSH